VLTDLHKEHVARLHAAYRAALERHSLDAVLIHSGSLAAKTRFDDQDWPLRPTPHFQHWLALAEPDCYLLVGQDKPILFRPPATSFWETRPELLAPWILEPFDIHESVALPAGKRLAFIGEHADKSFGLDVSTALIAELDALRTHKTPYEIACIAQANALAARGHEAVRAAFAAGETNELALHLLFLKATEQDDPETPYKNIVASGKNAATLHHVTYRKDASGAPSLLLDAGATYFGYCSDITRTWVRGSGAGVTTFAKLVYAIEAMQQSLCDAIRGGDTYEALHDLSHRLTSGVLREVKIVRDLSDEAIDAKGISRAFYPHGLGHSLGLQTHDVGCAVIKPRADNPFLRNTSVIERDQVFTIEPGVYFIESLLRPLREGEHAKHIDWALVDALAPLGGVRIEDDILVLPSSIRNFTREVLPRGGGAP
jgi:Xaa-Pro dipeptidase